jgi:hypothetical protein
MVLMMIGLMQIDYRKFWKAKINGLVTRGLTQGKKMMMMMMMMMMMTTTTTTTTMTTNH